MITQEQLQLWRELTGRLSYFGLEGMAQDAITALLAERDALAAELATVREAANVEWQAEHAARLVAEERLKAATVRADALQLELDCID